MLLLGGAAITITACGGDTNSPANPTPTASDKTGQIASNHGHAATITSGQQQAGGALTLDITGSAAHPHTLDLTAAEVTTIRNGGRVTKNSSINAQHDHAVTFN
jgi:hypothetical protein